MTANPEVSISAEEPQSDPHGQFWSPAKVTMTWPTSGTLPAPSVQVSIVATVRGQMTVDQLRAAHLQAAHDVLTAALLSIEKEPQAARVASHIVER